MQHARLKTRMLALILAVLFLMAMLVTPVAMLPGAMIMLLILLKLTASQQADERPRDERHACRRRLAHEASQVFRQRWAAPAGVAGKLDSNKLKNGGNCAAYSEKVRFTKRVRNVRAGNRRGAHRIRDQPITV